jgi:hypothetical protein
VEPKQREALIEVTVFVVIIVAMWFFHIIPKPSEVDVLGFSLFVAGLIVKGYLADERDKLRSQLNEQLGRINELQSHLGRIEEKIDELLTYASI